MRVLHGVTVVAFIAFVYGLYIAPPLDYPRGQIMTVETGTSISEVASRLKEAHAIQSESVFKLVAVLTGSNGVLAGAYSLTPANAMLLGYRFTHGDTGLLPSWVTLPEGATVRDMADSIQSVLGRFEHERFIQIATPYEGYLFPDTYHFVIGVSPDVVLRTLQENYEAKVAPLRPEIASSTRSEAEIITMASLLEREARKPETKAIIAGILWKRIQLGMPLQVDAVFGYIFGRDTYSPTLDDLAIDSPYNTYTNKGLPPGPISNPGLDSILAALRPTKTKYLYYLTGSDGRMYYASTFEQHIANRAKLR